MLLSIRLTEISAAMPAGQDDIAEELNLLARLASSIEQELEVHRLRERHRITHATMDRAATETLADLSSDPEGVVVRPDFKRKS